MGATSNKLTGFTQTLTTQRTNAAGNPVTSTVNSQVNYSLDVNGNLTSDGLRTFEYDAANRLSKVQVSQSAEASKITYLHNALGQRVFKSEPQVAQTAPNEAELGIDFITWLKKSFGWLFAAGQANATLGQSYVYDDSNLGSTPNLLGEYGNGGTKSAGRIEYIWLPTEDGTSIPIGIYKGGRFLAVHSDHLGTPRLITDDTSKPVWQWPYSAFGDNKPTGILKATPNPKAAITNVPQLLKATAPTEINLRFPGQFFDEESNLHYNYFRSYQPTQGRYTQPDPIGLAGGLNRFGYVGGNPLSNIDPLGLFELPSPKDVGKYWGEVGGATGDFARNYKDMRDAWWKGADKYFHCKANCEAAQRGPAGEDVACRISDTREWWDQNVKGYPASDSAADQAANQHGRFQGTMNPKGSCSAMCTPFRPHGLPAKY